MSKTYVTLNISASSVRLLSVRGQEVERWESMPLSPGLVRDGLILQPKVVGAVINALFESAGVSKERVIISLTGLPFTYRMISLPRMKPVAQHEAIQRAAQKEMQLPIEELHLSWQAIDDGGDEQDFFVLGVPRKILETMVQTLGEAGIKPYIMDIKPLALARAAKRRDAILMDLEPDCFDIILVIDGIPSVMHAVIPRGTGAVISDNIGRIAGELAKTIEFYNTSHHDKPLSSTMPLLLTGELSADTQTRELLQNTTGYPVEPLLPPFRLPPDLPVALFTTNIGLALKKTALKTVSKRATYFPREINVNLLLDAYGVKASRVKQTNIILTTALLIGISLLYPVYQFGNQAVAETMHLRTELIGRQQELDRRLVANNEAKQVESNISEILARVVRLKEEQQNILNRGNGFTSDLTLVTKVLPDKAYFTSVKMGNNQVTVEGEAYSSFAVIDYVSALEKTGKFSEVRIAWINESKGVRSGTTEVETPPVSFSIIISK